MKEYAMQKPTRQYIRHINSILFKQERKGTMKIFVGHADAYSRKFEAVNFFSCLNPKDAAYFCACLRKAFDHGATMTVQAFHKHSSKINLAQNGLI